MRFIVAILLGNLLAGAFSAAVRHSDSSPSRLRLLASVPIPSLGSAIVATSNGRELYLSQDDGHVIVIDPAKWIITTSLPVAARPRGLAITQDGSTVYVAHVGGLLTMIDTTSKTTRTLPVPRELLAPAVTPDGRYVYLPACSAGLQRIDRTTGTVRTIHTEHCPTFATASPNGEHLWVSYQGRGLGGSPGHDAIGDFDPSTGKLRGTITSLPYVGGLLALSPDGRYLWAHGLDACSNTAYDHLGCTVVPSAVIHVIDTASRQRIRSVVFPGPGVSTDRFTFSADGRWVAIGGLKLRLLDSKLASVISQEETAATYWAVAFSADSTKLLAISSKGPALRIYAMELASR